MAVKMAVHIILLLTSLTESASYHHDDDAGSNIVTMATECGYTFNVWRPEENVLRRLRDVEFTCSNKSLAWQQEFAQLRNQVRN